MSTAVRWARRGDKWRDEMEFTERATADYLLMLLHDQVGHLAAVASQVDSVTSFQLPDIPPAHWEGGARRVYDAAAGQLKADLAVLESSLREAIDQSKRAILTLGSRVG